MFSTANYHRRYHNKRKTHTQIATHKLISFQLRSERYAIPIDRVQRILNEPTSSASLTKGKGLVRLNEDVITLMDLSTLFWGETEPQEYNYLIVCTSQTQEFLGLLLSKMPSILEIPQDKFGEVPEAYRRDLNLVAVEKLIYAPDGQVFFLLNLDKI